MAEQLTYEQVQERVHRVLADEFQVKASEIDDESSLFPYVSNKGGIQAFTGAIAKEFGRAVLFEGSSITVDQVISKVRSALEA
ncbi:hypothetical protein ACQPW1_09360 [Nocardia sp. CA-128927]|uniref:hypothetical protein n=1 Tax=Nocardia sp. CA-128927 TaxID=3239975 RepID=UPI003D99135E